jgi:cytochrome c oxidase subunit I
MHDATSTKDLHHHGAGPHTSGGGWFKRPTAQTGLVSWLTTVDHKRIGIMYAISALFFLLVGGVEALIIRAQLAVPNNDLVSADFFNQAFTMHGTTMIFLAVMPLSAAFFNYFTPIMIGARDVAFPRLNAFSFWTFLAGAIFINSSWVLAHAPDIGWFGYAPLTSREYSPGLGTDFWVLGLQMLGLASLVAGFNFVVTIINMRAPGMKMMRLPVFVWMTLVTNFLIIISFPAITIALACLMMDRLAGTHFFEPAFGGQPILWQHLFWIFGHPEVYILILPAMGIISEIIPVFSRKPLFGYAIIVFSGILIGVVGFAVWSHHMFATGLSQVAFLAFALTTMAIAVPTGVKIFNWIGTLWGGQIRFTTPLLFAVGFIWMFLIGGLSGVTHSVAPANLQHTDTYYVVAHFHYVLIGGSLFSLIAAVYYWFPKVTGRMMSDYVGKWVFWTVFAGFNIAFLPMHWLGLGGMPRRIYTYQDNMGWNEWNMVATIGAFLLGIGIAAFIIQAIYSVKKGKKAPADPWDARTLEWMIPSPPPVYNFARTPTVTHRDEYWHRKHTPAKKLPPDEAPDAHGIHMPDQSWYPLIVALGILIGVYGVLYMNVFFIGPFIGLAIAVLGIYGWALEGPGGYHIHPDKEEK